MPTATQEEIKRFAESIWPEYEIEVGPIEDNRHVAGVPRAITRYAVAVRGRDGRYVDQVTADTMDKLRELIEQKLNRG
jgi:hypothetical protein